jgi:hypothetical protein
MTSIPRLFLKADVTSTASSEVAPDGRTLGNVSIRGLTGLRECHSSFDYAVVTVIQRLRQSTLEVGSIVLGAMTYRWRC